MTKSIIPPNSQKVKECPNLDLLISRSDSVEIKRLHRSAEDHWPYRSKLAKQVYQAILIRANEKREWEFNISIQWIWGFMPSATDAGIHKALAILERYGLITKLSGRYEGIRVMVNLMSTKLKSKDFNELNIETTSYPTISEQKMLNMIGYAAGMVYHCLTEEPQTIQSIVGKSGCNRKTVRKYLGKLMKSGLALCVPAGRHPQWLKW